jgi:integrase
MRPGAVAHVPGFLSTGFRERELAYLPWRNLDLATRIVSVKEVRVKGRSQFNFRPKDSEERDIKLPLHVVEALARRREERPNDYLVFPSASGLPEEHFLRDLKEIALGAGLNCGHYVGVVNRKEVSCSKYAVCEHWKLHRFRKTFATRLLKLAKKGFCTTICKSVHSTRLSGKRRIRS